MSTKQPPRILNREKMVKPFTQGRILIVEPGQLPAGKAEPAIDNRLQARELHPRAELIRVQEHLRAGLTRLQGLLRAELIRVQELLRAGPTRLQGLLRAGPTRLQE